VRPVAMLFRPLARCNSENIGEGEGESESEVDTYEGYENIRVKVKGSCDLT
jgi:hypothetical protein